MQVRPPSLSDLSPRAAATALLITLAAAGLWPYRPILGWLPWGVDAIRWVGNGSPDDPGWWRWALASKHFVGYRPVTALSFVANTALTGHSALGYRATDLGLHLITGALLFALYRRATGDRSACSLIPVLALFAHPATEEVVPHVARRSYLLALGFGLGALLCFLRALDTRSLRWALASAGLLGLGVLSNEVAYVLVPLLPLWIALRPAGGRRAEVLSLWPAALVTALALLARYRVLGTFGGYQRRLFAFVEPERDIPMWRELPDWQPWRIASACWTYALDPSGVTGRPPLISGGWAPWAVAAVSLWLGWFGIVRPLLRIRDPKERAGLWFAAWAAGALAIVVLSQTWFWRQAHGLLPPLGALLALGLRSTLVDLRDRPIRAVPSLGIGLLALLAMGWNGPLRGGLAQEPHAQARAGTPLVARIGRLLGQVRGPATVYLVAPVPSRTAHIVRLWGDLYGRPERIGFRLLGHLRPNARRSTAALELRRDRRPPLLRLGAGMTFAPIATVRAREPSRDLPIDRLWRGGGRQAWLFAMDADDAWAIRIPEPAAGVEPLPDLPDPEPPEEEPGPEIRSR